MVHLAVVLADLLDIEIVWLDQDFARILHVPTGKFEHFLGHRSGEERDLTFSFSFS
jgi:hypothetical protein